MRRWEFFLLARWFFYWTDEEMRVDYDLCDRQLHKNLVSCVNLWGKTFCNVCIMFTLNVANKVIKSICADLLLLRLTGFFLRKTSVAYKFHHHHQDNCWFVQVVSIQESTLRERGPILASCIWNIQHQSSQWLWRPSTSSCCLGLWCNM